MGLEWGLAAARHSGIVSCYVWRTRAQIQKYGTVWFDLAPLRGENDGLCPLFEMQDGKSTRWYFSRYVFINDAVIFTLLIILIIDF